MARRTVEKEIDDLAALAKHPDAPDARQRLAAGLNSRSSFVVAKAASIALKLNRKDLTAELIGAFDRFLNNPRLADKGCEAKTAMAKALYEFGDPNAEGVFLAGIKHVQMEGSYGPPVDAAAELRGISALGLVRNAHRHVMYLLVDLLDDPVAQARCFAARALAYSEREEAALLLRFKLLRGDVEIDVINECMSALIRLRQPDLAKFLARFLDHDEPEIRISAALALGETRQADALDALRNHFGRERDADVRRSILLAAAMLRLPQAVNWLVEIVESAGTEAAASAIEAMALYRRDAAIVERIRAAAAIRQDPPIQRALAQHLPETPL